MTFLFSSLLYMMSFSTVGTFDNAQDSLNKHGYEYYLQKSKSQRTAATILVATGTGGGLITLAFALLATVGDVFLGVASLGYYQPKRRSYTVPLLLSGAVIAAGIVLFAAASRNKKIAKGISISAGVGNTSLLQQQRFESYAYPTLSLKIGF